MRVNDVRTSVAGASFKRKNKLHLNCPIQLRRVYAKSKVVEILQASFATYNLQCNCMILQFVVALLLFMMLNGKKINVGKFHVQV